MAQYTHNTGFHNLDAPKEIVPFIMKLIKPRTVIDIGCGIGTFMKVFKDNGVETVHGIDGPWCDRELLFKHIDPNEFQEKNLEQDLGVKEKYDLAVCLEVAEHLTPKRAETFIQELTTMADVILFSAAIPNQGGDHHYNEQWLTYWENLFNKHQFKVFDILRPYFWDNPNIYFWYKQNMVLVVKSGIDTSEIEKLQANIIPNVVHPELLSLITDYRDKNAIKRYVKILAKALGYRLGLVK